MSERVNVCVIVGNGFDMAAGLDTSTEAFVSCFAELHAGEDSPAGRLASQIAHDGPKTWADFERKLGEYAAVVEGSADDAVSEYVAAKSAMEMGLVEFIKEREGRVDPDKVEKTAKACLSSICDWVGALPGLDRQRVHGHFDAPYTFDISFVTLNYTGVLDTMVELQRTAADASHAATDVAGYRLRSCVHAHGELAGNAICGVDNASQIHSSKLAEDDAVLETVVKGATQEMLGSLDDQNALSLIDAAEVIMVFGCSMGVTDARWWSAVVNRLASSASKRLAVIFAHGFERNGRPAAEVRRLINEQKEKLIGAAGLSDFEGKKELFKRIFVLPSSAIFKMPEALIIDSAE